jgi:hypothetical protein
MEKTLMELDVFISTALEQIVLGVDKSKDCLSDLGVVLNPDVKGKAEDLASAGVITSMDRARSETKGEKPRKAVVRVRFDIAVAAEKRADGGVKLGVLGSLLGVDAKAQVEKKGSAEHRIQFEVPLRLRSYAPDA